MYTKTSVIALLGLASFCLTAAAPGSDKSGGQEAEPISEPYGDQYDEPSDDSYNSHHGSRFSTGNVVTAGYVVQPIPTEVHHEGNKFRFPLSNDFPNPGKKEIKDIEKIAGGTQPNREGDGVPPSADTLTSNITSKVPGYGVKEASELNVDLDNLIIILATIQAQEELHTLEANGVLAATDSGPIKPCKYVFPVDNLKDAIALASTFTDVVLGTLQDIAFRLGKSGDADVICGVTSVLGQKGEQNCFFRLFQGKRPAAEPFLTASTREFAFSALNQAFVVPGSCPNIDTIDLPIFKPLKQIGKTEPKDSCLTFQIEVDKHVDPKDLSLVLINGQNTPIVEKLEKVKKVDHGVIQFDAPFRFEKDLLFGLTIAAVTNTNKGLSYADKVAEATLFGPALIEVK